MSANWESWYWKLGLASALALGEGLPVPTLGNCAFAQIVPDGTLGAERSVVTPDADDQTVDAISGGATRGANLFHSFEQFSVLTGRTAFFSNPAAIANIISRITGGSISNIDGIIRAKGSANLFLINPNGISFGPNASLEIGGSFVASTASSLKFADGTEFSATAPGASPLLTVNVPLGLQFGSTAGTIVNQSQAELNSEELAVGLRVPSGKTLALVGGNVVLDNGNLTAEGGRVELGSVAPTGLVSLTPVEKGYALGYAGVQNFQDIQLFTGAIVDASGESGGDIQVQGRNVTLTGDSQIFSSNSGAEAGGTLAVNASESVEMSGDETKLATYTSGTGAAGNLTIETRKLIVRDGAYIETIPEAEGRGGDLTVKASDAVELVGTTSDGKAPSGLFALVEPGATGAGGNLIIDTGRLLILGGAHATTSTYGVGRAGNLLVRASSIELIGAGGPNDVFPSALLAQVEEEATTGDAGNLTIETERLTVLGGAQVSVAARNEGNAGTLTINASDSIFLSGTSSLLADGFSGDVEADFLGSSGVFVSAQPGAIGDSGDLKITTEQLTVEDGSQISAANFGTGKGGNATLNIKQLIIRNGGLVGAGSFDQGPGGTLTVNASDSVEVSGTGTIGLTRTNSILSTRSKASGDAGNLNITTGRLIVQDRGNVTVSSTGSGKAGELTVKARSIELDNNGALTATTNSGNGGDIAIQSQDLLLLRRNSKISSSAGTAQAGGDGGNISIDTPFLITVPDENSDITANAFNGRGGRVAIAAQNIFGIEQRSRQELQTLLGTDNPSDLDPSRLPSNDITAISQTNPELSGQVTINSPDVDPEQGLVELPVELVDASNQIASACATTGENKFTVTGRGGLPPNPRQTLNGEAVLTNWATLKEGAGSREQGAEEQGSKQKIELVGKWTQGDPIVEATGWEIGSKGEVILTAQAPSDTLEIPWLTPASCSASKNQ